MRVHHTFVRQPFSGPGPFYTTFAAYMPLLFSIGFSWTPLALLIYAHCLSHRASFNVDCRGQ